MIRKLFLIWLSVLCLLVNALTSSAKVIINGVEINDDGKIVYLDKSEQGTATIKGDTGQQGPQGIQGVKGDPAEITKEAICAIYSSENATPPTFCPSAKRIFVTSQKFNGNLEGLVGADAKCQSAANSAGLPGQYIAWLSSSTVALKDRVIRSTLGPYYRTNGAIIASNWSDLTDGSLNAPILCDEYKNCPVPVGQGFSEDCVWTNTNPDGSLLTIPALNSSCYDWTSASNYNDGSIGYQGSKNASDTNWTTIGYWGYCDGLRSLYCIQQ